jgi:peptide/nickel transport system substrate-binding protein
MSPEPHISVVRRTRLFDMTLRARYKSSRRSQSVGPRQEAPTPPGPGGTIIRMQTPTLRRLPLLLVVAMLASACTAAQMPAGSQSTDPTTPNRASKRLSAVIMGDPKVFSTTITPVGQAGAGPGLQEMEDMMMAGLSNVDDRGRLRPLLAEAVPSIDNGLWILEPDGRMLTTWKIRAGAIWHDGVPFTTDDLLFTARVGSERGVPEFANPVWSMIDTIDVPDQTTVTVRWNRSFLNADSLFSRQRGMPLPRHILEAPYVTDKTTFTDLSYWNDGFIGTGAYRLQELVHGSHLLLTANDSFVLGRPRIDVIDVKIVPDATTLVTNLLAGAAELTLGARISLDEAIQVRDQWRDGRVEFAQTTWMVTYPQLLNPDPPIMLDARFRRALQYAIDRQQIMEAIMAGLTQVADSTVSPNQVDYPEVESAIIRYPYDPARAAQLFTELGYVRGVDGFYADRAGTKLQVEARATAQLDYQPKSLAIVSDYWQRAGVVVDQIVVPNQRVPDREYRHTRSGFEVLGLSNDPDNFRIFVSAQTPLPANAFSGLNRSRYMNPDYDGLVDKYFATIPRPDRMLVLRDIVHLLSDELVFMGLFYTTTHTAVGKRVKNATARGPASTDGWNSEQWDLE